MNPFTPDFNALPSTLPIFPLSGTILLPQGQLPLNIFEPRYLNMTFDALGADRMIGMIQPDASAVGRARNGLYPTGCAGRISSFAETNDGRLLITLTGACRFDVAEEIKTTRGYRRVIAGWQRFEDDTNEQSNGGVDSATLLDALSDYFESRKVQAEWDSLRKLSGQVLVNILAMNLPFEPADKQALVEAVTPWERMELLVALAQLSVSDRDRFGPIRH
jgi:Lon protease-like protein